MLYKITNAKNQTRNGMQWGAGVTHTATGDGVRLCSDGVIHCYEDALLAVMMDPIHGKYLADSEHLWLAEGDVFVSDGLKSGCRTLTTTQRVDAPIVTPAQRIAFGILCAKQVYTGSRWCDWADMWLSGEDRTVRAAEAAGAAAKWAARAASTIDFAAIAKEAVEKY